VPDASADVTRGLDFAIRLMVSRVKQKNPSAGDLSEIKALLCRRFILA
jgi:hypothetical protein